MVLLIISWWKTWGPKQYKLNIDAIRVFKSYQELVTIWIKLFLPNCHSKVNHTHPHFFSPWLDVENLGFENRLNWCIFCPVHTSRPSCCRFHCKLLLLNGNFSSFTSSTQLGHGSVFHLCQLFSISCWDFSPCFCRCFLGPFYLPFSVFEHFSSMSTPLFPT